MEYVDEPDTRKYKECAYCRTDLEDEYYTYRDNFLQLKFFEESDGSDNAFCSDYCAGMALMLEMVDNIYD